MKKVSKKSDHQSANNSQFDEALPEQILGATPDTSRSLKINGRLTQPSPYIIKLSRPSDQSEVVAPLNQAELDALAQSLEIDFDDVLDLPPEEADIPEDLSLTIQDLKDQLREDDYQVTGIKVAPKSRAKLPVSQHDQAVPIDIWSDLKTLDVVAALELPPVERAIRPVAELQVLSFTDEAEPIIEQSSVSKPGKRNHSKRNALVSFVALALVLVLPLHALQVLANTEINAGQIERESQVALDQFLRGTTSLSNEDFAGANHNFQKASSGFVQAESSLQELNAGVVAISKVMPSTDKTVQSAKALVTAGKELSDSASILSLAGSDLAKDNESLELTTRLKLLNTYLKEALPHMQTAAAAMSQVSVEMVPTEHAQAVADMQVRVPQVVTAVEEYVKFVDALAVILGADNKMRYLAMFQNNTELRATGGFMGSFAEVDVYKGEMTKMFVPGGGTYDVQGQLKAYVAAPGPMQLLRARWEFQDANWFPDFPSSAKKLKWFYSESGGPTVDGVLAVNATFIAELLKILGPVELPEYGRTFDAENFLFEVQKIVELEYDKTDNAPKEVLGDLAPILLERLQTADVPTLLAAVDLLAQGLQEKDILLNFSDNDLQATIENLGWSGSLKQTDGDYLMLVNTNLGGGKTDGVIDQQIDMHVEIQPDGSVQNTVTITKTHRGLKAGLFTGSNNVDYLRLYVPKGSQLLKADGFEIPPDELFEVSDVPLNIDEDLALHLQDLRKDQATGTDIWSEDGKTVFGNWMQTASGETEVVSFTYVLPFNLKPEAANSDWLSMVKDKLGLPKLTDYTVLLQKQPGVVSRQTRVELKVPANWTSLWNSTGSPDTFVMDANNQQDNFAGWLFETN